MTAIIAASCTFPSGPTLPLADIAHRLQFSLVRKHPLCVDSCGYPIKASYFPDIIYAAPEERFRQLTRQALTELTEHQPALKVTLQPRRIWLLLPFPDRPGMTPDVAAVVREAIEDCTGWLHSELRILHGGQAEIATALEVIRQRQPGAVEILLAVDSWLPPASLMWLEQQNLLHGSRRYFQGTIHPNPYGRIPSEGAAALALTTGASDISPWCFIRGSGTANESVTYQDDGVCLGKGLIQAALEALNVARATSVANVISDVNGEPYRADELGFTLLRLSENLDKDYQRETPVLASGDLGCASLLAHIALVAWRMRNTALRTDALILSSSDDQRRGAVVVSHEPEQE
ncbi:hypothetical protein CDR68_24315 [Salmonella enterica]|nr:hypothetical protein [Salmonella enterica]